MAFLIITNSDLELRISFRNDRKDLRLVLYSLWFLCILTYLLSQHTCLTFTKMFFLTCSLNYFFKKNPIQKGFVMFLSIKRTIFLLFEKE